ncbi:MAG: hypothetical protein IJC26_02430 [Clostridia bacterium]|nr:hypothetical protein [Clostridia bacterium]
MKKRIGAVCLMLAGALLFGACSEGEGVRYDYDLSEYVELEQLEPIRAPFADPTVCTEDEIDYAIHQIMLSYAEFTPKEEGAVIEAYDKAVLDYKIMQDGKELEEYCQPEYGIVIGYDGNGDIDYTLAKELEGKKVGDVCKVEYTFPTDDVSLGSWAGVTVECQGEVKGIYSALVPECTDEFVQKLEKFNFSTVQEFRDQIRIDTMEQKQEAKRKIVLDTFIAGVKVKKYPDAELKAYVEKYVAELKDMAEELDMEYADYISEYMQATEDQINEFALEDSRNRVKNDMACIQATRLMNVTLTEEEYKEGLERYYSQEQENFESVEAFEEHYTKPFMEDCIRWDKAFEMMVENAVSTL